MLERFIRSIMRYLFGYSVPNINNICSHIMTKGVYIFDTYYDYYTDNDDMEDIPTLLKVVYCIDCGKILSKKIIHNNKYDGACWHCGYDGDEHEEINADGSVTTYWTYEECKNCPHNISKSSIDEITEFKRICGIKCDRDFSIVCDKEL